MTDNTPSRREELERLRVTLLEAIAGARDLAPLARELRQTLAELERTAAPAEPSAADEILARRTVRPANVPRRPQSRRDGGSNGAGGRRPR